MRTRTAGAPGAPLVPATATAMALVLATTTVLAVGCVPAYVAPQTGPTAELDITLANDVGHQAAAIYDEPVECRGLRALPRAETGQYRVTLPAGRPVSLLMGSDVIDGQYVQQCRTVLTFVPEAGKAYAARFLPLEAGRRCVASLDERATSAGSPVPVRFAARDHLAPAVASSPSCDAASYPATR